MTHALCFYSYNDRKRKGVVIALTLPVISGRAHFFSVQEQVQLNLNPV